MGWFTDFLFGNPAKTGDEPVLPKQVEQWQSASGEPRPTPDGSGVSGGVDDSPSNDPYHDNAGHKSVPEVEVERIEAHLSSDMHHVEVWAHIKNRSPFTIELTRINFLRQHTDPDRFLKSGECHEIRIYNGDTPRTDAEHKAEVQYKIIGNGDYFQADHMIKYQYERHGAGEFYVPEELDLIHPIRDI